MDWWAAVCVTTASVIPEDRTGSRPGARAGWAASRVYSSVQLSSARAQPSSPPPPILRSYMHMGISYSSACIALYVPRARVRLPSRFSGRSSLYFLSPSPAAPSAPAPPLPNAASPLITSL